MIFCMEKSHLNRLRLKYPEAMAGKEVVCLNIPDEFEFMEPALIEEFQGSLAPYLTLPGDS